MLRTNSQSEQPSTLENSPRRLKPSTAGLLQSEIFRADVPEQYAEAPQVDEAANPPPLNADDAHAV